MRLKTYKMAMSIMPKFLTLKWNISRTIWRIEVGDGSFFCIFHALSFELKFFFDRRFPLNQSYAYITESNISSLHGNGFWKVYMHNCSAMMVGFRTFLHMNFFIGPGARVLQPFLHRGGDLAPSKKMPRGRCL